MIANVRKVHCKFDTHVDVILGEALPQVVDVGVPNPVVVRAALDWVTLTPHLAQVVGSNLFRGMPYIK